MSEQSGSPGRQDGQDAKDYQQLHERNSTAADPQGGSPKGGGIGYSSPAQLAVGGGAVVRLGGAVPRLARDYERLAETVAGWHWMAFAVIMLTRLFLDSA